MRQLVSGARAGDLGYANQLRLIVQSQEAELGSQPFLAEVLPADELDSVEDAALDLLGVLFLATTYDAFDNSYRYSLPELLRDQARLGNSVAVCASALLESAFRRAQQGMRDSKPEPTAEKMAETSAGQPPPVVSSDGPRHERKTMGKVSQWATDLILRPQIDVLAETVVMEPEDAASQMFRIQLLYAYIAAVDPNGPIANDPRKTEDPLIRLMLRLADPAVYNGYDDDLHWIAFFTVLRDESAEGFAHWVTSHRHDFWWRERDMPEVASWVYKNAHGDVVQRFPHMNKAMEDLQTALAAQLASGAQSRSSASSSASGRQSNQGGCYIATAVYGSYEAPEVLTLRRFRDERMAPTRAGRAFVRTYYRVSPMMAKHFAPGSVGHRIARTALTRLVQKLDRSNAGSSQSTG